MKFTSEDLMKAMGLQVGDRVKTDLGNIFIITRHIEEGIVITNENAGCYSSLEFLVDTEFEILPRPKRVGDLKCEYYVNCDDGCPLCWLCTHYDRNMLSKEIREDFNLYDILNAHDFDFDDEIHNLLKARLDKVVEE